VLPSKFVESVGIICGSAIFVQTNAARLRWQGKKRALVFLKKRKGKGFNQENILARPDFPGRPFTRKLFLLLLSAFLCSLLLLCSHGVDSPHALLFDGI
jgi:hypothetical protein